ncbi:MAG TPA: GspMb/PilO family protein [Bryobacteraceae bacterium]|nr:GspMb/PilO family protein [Bryobacteraceae bacterium]HPT29255.1 GspMb/PilO family protein [Bryobacteraceae bacterium]
MNALSERDRRAVMVLAVLAAVFLAIRFWPESDAGTVVESSSIPQLERRVQRLRQIDKSLGSREAVGKKVAAALAGREKGLIQAETAAQAEAQILQVIRRVLRAQTPPVELRGSELRPPRPIGEHYGEVSVQVTLDCGIEQVLNLLSDLGSQPEALGTGAISFDTANPKLKTVPARIVVAALVPKKLLPKKEGTR